MNIEEAIDKFTSESISILIEHDGEKVSLSGLNYHSGSCGCCTEINTIDECKVEKVVDINTMEILFEDK